MNLNIRSPKNGFVIKLFVSDNETVKAGARLLQMDSEIEDKYSRHLQVLETMREVRAAKYTGPELEVLRTAAKLSVDTSADRLKSASQIEFIAKARAVKGLLDWPDYYNTASLKAQAEWEHGRAEAQQKELEFAVARHNQLNDIAKNWNDDQQAYIAKRKSHLTVLSPIDGNVKLLIGEGSFAKHGNVILEIEERR